MAVEAEDAVTAEPLVAYIQAMPYHDRELLLRIMEVAKTALILDSTERDVFQGFLLALWKSVKLEEIG